MRYFYYTFLFLMISVAGLRAQNKNTARNLFNEGRFAEAKPMFEKLLKGSPKNAEYNFWYAACCIETGEDSVDVYPMLEIAVSRKITNAYRYMGEYCLKECDYPNAAKWFDDFIDRAKGDDMLELGYDRLDYANRLSRMVRNTEDVCFIDSFVVDKSDFLEVYRMGNDVGQVAFCSDYFDDPSLPGVLYESERGMDIYFSDENEDSIPRLKLYYNTKVGDDWASPKPLAGFDTGGNDDFPFMLADGITLYFASDGDGSIGGYDLFVTSFDEESGEFYRPDQLGMPFNSTANDYMLAINEVVNIGWFASDRNQPEGKVCVYVFVPNAKKQKYDIEALGYETVLSYARISSIADTQTDEDVVRRARQQFAMLLYANGEDSKGDFHFVVDDLHEYKAVSDFKSEAARNLYKEWQACEENYRSDVVALDKLRDEYASATKQRKNVLKNSILPLEKKVETEEAALVRMINEVRRLEQTELYK